MQFEDFDKKFREAAEHHHPAYNEKAWHSMEKMLNKHLPLKKDKRRRFFFFLLLFIVAGGSAYLWTAKPWKSHSLNNGNEQTIAQPSTSPVQNKDQQETKTTNDDKDVSANAVPDQPLDDKNTVEGAVNEEPGAVEEATVAEKPGTTKRPVKNNLQDAESGNIRSNVSSDINNPVAKAKAPKKTDNRLVAGDKAVPSQPGNELANKNNKETDNKQPISSDPVVTPNADQKKTNNPVPDTENARAQIDNNKPVIKESSKAKDDTITSKEQATKTAGKKTPKKYLSALGFTISSGPDVSAVGVDKVGKMNCVLGAGLSYTYKRFTLRSGFYVVKKVYTASPDEYHPPKHYWTNYVDLTKVDADCKVFEVPVTVSYNFGQTRNHGWFVTAGLSSFFMEQETYEYYYKDTAGNPRQRTWSTKDKNKHIFSILNLGAGYEKKLSKNVSVLAEPYFKVPLDGIGFGKIQLNSMGVLVSLHVKPFTPRK